MNIQNIRKPSSDKNSIGYFLNISSQVQRIHLNPFQESEYSSNFIRENWALTRSERSINGLEYIIPVQAGRAIYANEVGILLKGTGKNSEWTEEKNEVRYGEILEKAPFDGKITFQETIVDMYNSEFLSALGIRVATPVASIELKDGGEYQHGIYARKFIDQTRISDLYSMDRSTIIQELLNAREILTSSLELEETISLEDYFMWMVYKMALSTGRMQAAGYQHGVIHAQQITLAGEFVDHGSGYWLHDDNFNIWRKKPHLSHFKFEYQPLAVLNTLLRTHVMTANPPVKLGTDSTTYKLHKKSLLGIIKQIDEQAYHKIIERKPQELFMQVLETTYQMFDYESFIESFKPSSYFDFDAKGVWLSKNLIDEDTVLEKPNIYRFVVNRHYQHRKPNYYIDQELSQSGLINRLKDDGLAEVPVNIEGNIITNSNQTVAGFKNVKMSEARKSPWYQNNVTLPDIFWNLNLSPHHDQILKTYIEEFHKKVKEIKYKHKTLQTPDAIFEVLMLLNTSSHLAYKGYNKDHKFKEAYKNFVRERWSTEEPEQNLGYLIKHCMGECHDSTLLAFILSLTIQKEDPDYNFRIVKTNIENGKHYFLTVKTPSNKLYVIDGINNLPNTISPWKALVQKGSPLNIGEHHEIENILDFQDYQQVPKSCNSALRDFIDSL